MTEQELRSILGYKGINFVLDKDKESHKRFLEVVGRHATMGYIYNIKDKRPFGILKPILESNSHYYLSLVNKNKEELPIVLDIEKYMEYYDLLGITLGQYLLNVHEYSEFKPL